MALVGYIDHAPNVGQLKNHSMFAVICNRLVFLRVGDVETKAATIWRGIE